MYHTHFGGSCYTSTANPSAENYYFLIGIIPIAAVFFIVLSQCLRCQNLIDQIRPADNKLSAMQQKLQRMQDAQAQCDHDMRQQKPFRHAYRGAPSIAHKVHLVGRQELLIHRKIEADKQVREMQEKITQYTRRR